MTVKSIRRPAKRVANLIARMYGIRMYPGVTSSWKNFLKKYERIEKFPGQKNEKYVGFAAPAETKRKKLKTFAYIDKEPGIKETQDAYRLCYQGSEKKKNLSLCAILYFL